MKLFAPLIRFCIASSLTGVFLLWWIHLRQQERSCTLGSVSTTELKTDTKDFKESYLKKRRVVNTSWSLLDRHLSKHAEKQQLFDQLPGEALCF